MDNKRQMRKLPSPAWLRRRLEYRNGQLFWKRRPRGDFVDERSFKVWNSQNPGERAGSQMSNGYRIVGMLDSKFLEHRLIFQMELRALGEGETVDHEDQNHRRNETANFRGCTHAKNLMNQPGRRPGGLPKHVYWSELEKKYKVGMRADGNKHHIGTFKKLEEAAAAAMEARIRLHGEFADHRGSA